MTEIEWFTVSLKTRAPQVSVWNSPRLLRVEQIKFSKENLSVFFLFQKKNKMGWRPMYSISSQEEWKRREVGGKEMESGAIVA